MTPKHESFLKRLRDSLLSVFYAARWFVEHGVSVTMRPVRYAPTASDWEKNIDDGDLQVTARVEVRKSSYPFTCRADFPYPDRFIVAEKGCFDRADPKPFMTMFLNPEQTHAAIVLTATRPSWRVENIFNSLQQANKDYYCTRAEEAVFFPLGEGWSGVHATNSGSQS